MPTKKDAKKRTVEAGASKKVKKGQRDYGEAVTDFKVPEGFQEGESSIIQSFNQFGDKAEGKFVILDKQGKKKTSRVLQLEKNGVISKHWASQDVVNLLENNKIVKGDQICIVFVNANKFGKNRVYKMYKIYFKRGKK
jgi:hypothetical protein